MRPPDDWLSDMLARSDDFAPGEIEKARAFVEAIQRDALAPPRPALVAIFQKVHQMRMLDEADAKLMSASPELLLACRLLLEATGELVESADCDPDSPDAVNILGAVATARDAIAKATAR